MALIIVGTGLRLYREYLLRSIRPRYRVHLFLSAEPGWEREYVHGWTVLHSTGDVAELTVAARAVAAREPIDGVLCWDEARILPSTELAAALGLPGGDLDVVRRCRDKHLTREALAVAGVPQPRSILVGTVDRALEAATEIGYPVVLKPRALAASLGVVKVDTAEELVAQFAFARDTTVPEAPQYDESVLVEEFADGPEISVDSVVYHGRVLPMCLARKELGYPPYFEEVGHRVDANDPLLTDPETLDLLQRTHNAISFRDGATHTEIRLTRTGPKVIEVNARLGGGMIPYLGLLATGVDPGLAAAAVACGQAPDVTPSRALAAAVRFFYVDEEDTVIGSIGFADGGLPPAIDQLVVLAEPGVTRSPPPKGTAFGRVAYATAAGSTTEECRVALDAAEAALTVRAASELAAS